LNNLFCFAPVAVYLCIAGNAWFYKLAYQVVVNARTGEVQGERPFSVVKITFLVMVILAIVALIVYLGKN